METDLSTSNSSSFTNIHANTTKNTKTGSQTNRNNGMVILPPTILSGTTRSGSSLNTMEVSIHQCSKIMLREIAQVFPCLSSVRPKHSSNTLSITDVKETYDNDDENKVSLSRTDNQTTKIIDRQDVLAIPTIQKSVMDIVQIGPEIEKEKDRCLEAFVEFASELCDEIDRHGYWADYIDPCSGLPMLNKERAHHYNEVDGFQHLLRYQTQNAGCCKILLHPRYGSSCYPATLFTVAPRELVLQIFQESFLSS